MAVIGLATDRDYHEGLSRMDAAAGALRQDMRANDLRAIDVEIAIGEQRRKNEARNTGDEFIAKGGETGVSVDEFARRYGLTEDQARRLLEREFDVNQTAEGRYVPRPRPRLDR